MALRTENPLATAVFAVLLAASLSPVLLVAIPAMVDYPNHLARMYILSASGTPDANPFYRLEWSLSPNLAMDLAIPQLARLIGVENACRLFLLLSQVLIVSGATAIERAMKGRVHIAGFAALMFLYCLPFTWGFLNFEFGMGVALWGIAAMLSVQERNWRWRLAVNMVFVAALFAAHFFALGVYGATLGLYELWRAFAHKSALRETALRLLVLALPALLFLAVMKLTAGAIGGEETVWHFKFKALWLFIILNGYNVTVSAACVTALIGFLTVAVRRGVLTLTPAGVWLAAGFALLYLAIPSRLYGTAFVDLRIIAAAAFILPAFCTLALPSRAWRRAALGCATLITLANLAVVYTVWLSYRADYAAVIQSFGKLDKGALVLIGGSDAFGDPPLQNLTSYPMAHAPTLAVYYAKAFVPNLFTAPGKQPVRPRQDMERLNTPESGQVPINILVAIAAGKTADIVPVYLRSWQRDFDYLYVLGPRIDNLMPDLLEEIDSAPRFVLYKIRRTR